MSDKGKSVQMHTESEEYYVKIADEIIAVVDFKEILEDVSVERVVDELVEDFMKKPELGGITDPIGQLIHWAVETLQGFINSMRMSLEGFMRTVVDGARSAIESAISATQNAIIGTINTLQRTISNWVNSILSAISDAVTSITSSITSFITSNVLPAFDSLFSSIQGFIRPLYEALSSAIAGISATVENALAGMQSFIMDAISGISATISNIAKSIAGIVGDISRVISEGISNFIAQAQALIKPLQDALTNFWAWLTSSLANLSASIMESFKSLSEAVMGTIDMIRNVFEGAFQGFISSFMDAWTKVQEFFKEAYNKLASGLKDVGVVLQGFVNAVMRLPEAFAQIFEGVAKAISGLVEAIMKFLSDPLGTLKGAIDWLAGQIWNLLPEWLRSAIEAIKNFFTNLWGEIQKFVEDPWGYLFSKFEEIGKWIWEALPDFMKTYFEKAKELFSTIIEVGAETIKTFLEKSSEFFKKVAELIIEFVTDPVRFWKKYLFKFMTDAEVTLDAVMPRVEEMKPAILTVISPAIGGLMAVLKTVKPYDPDEPWEFLENFLSKASEALVDIEFASYKVEAKYPFKYMGAGGQIGQAIGAGIVGALASSVITPWASKLVEYPSTYWVHRTFRPVILDVSDAIEAYVREKISEDDYKLIMEKHGFKDTYINALYDLWFSYLTKTEIRELFYRGVIDFESVIKYLKLAKVHEEIRDLYVKTWAGKLKAEDARWVAGIASRVTPEGEVQIEEWALKALQRDLMMEGYIPDIAPEELKGAYEKILEMAPKAIAIIPSISDLITFSVKEVYEFLRLQYDLIKRSAPPEYLKIAWTKGMSEYWALAYWEAHWRLVSLEHLADLYFRGELSTEEYKTYLRYWDFRPYPRPNFKLSDIEMARRALYEIPLRIDARWMARWGIAKVEDMARIVIMRRVHPEWRGKIISAEWVNNLLDERTRLLSSLLKNLEKGYIGTEEFTKIVSKYTMKALPTSVTVTGEGGESTTIEIPTEIWLLNPDEIALNIMRADYEALERVRDAQLDAILRNYIRGRLTDAQMSAEVSKLIKRKDLAEATVLKFKARKLYRMLYFTQRALLRYIDAVFDAFEAGYITLDRARELIEKYAGKLLTEEDIAIITAERILRSESYKKKLQMRVILRKLKRGMITPDEAFRELTRLDIPEELARDLVEENMRYYTITIERARSLAEDVVLPPDLIKKLFSTEIVPEEWIPYVLKSFMIRPIRSEVNRLVTELITDYAEGAITRRQLEDWLKALEEVGVTPDERAILLTLAELRRKRYEMGRRRGR